MSKINFDKIYYNNSGEAFEIIGDLGNINPKVHDKYARIKFLKTGFEKDASYGNILHGKVQDEISCLRIGEIDYSLYYGPYTIMSYEGIDDKGFKLVKIHFHLTGFEYILKSQHVNDGKVTDYSVTKPISTINIIPPIIYEQLIYDNLRSRWRLMIDKCYNKNSPSYSKYGMLGVYVHPIWHNLDSFLTTIKGVNGYSKFYQYPFKYQLDKDYIQFGQPTYTKFYSPITCMFLCNTDNTNLAILEKENTFGKCSPQEYLMKRHYNNSKPFGITESCLKDKPDEKRYQVCLFVNGESKYLGTYTNIDAAISVYNHYYLFTSEHELVSLFNYPKHRLMSFEEAQIYRTEL